MLERNYKRLERIIIVIMIVGIIAMFQPWFKNIVELFDPLAPEARLGRTYRNEIAPIILRYGFFATFLSTIAFIVTFLLIALPVFYGFVVLAHLATAQYYAAILGVISFICAIAVWLWKRWGLIGLVLTSLIGLGLAFIGLASMPIAILILIVVIVVVALIWPRRTALN
jgi:hypothetical protein